MGDPSHVPDRQPVAGWKVQPGNASRRYPVSKRRRRLSPDTEKLIVIMVSAIEPIAQLIDAISRIR